MLTAAHPTLPLPSFLYVTNRANSRTVLVRVNDRVPANADRVVVVSQRAADLLNFRGVGRAEVDLQYAGPAAQVSTGQHEKAFLQRQPWFNLNEPSSTNARTQRYTSPTYPRWDNTSRQ